MILIIVGIVLIIILAAYLFVRSLMPEYQNLQDSKVFQQAKVEEIMEDVILDVSPLDEQGIIQRCDEKMAQSLKENSLSDALKQLG